ncbi:hypothetical protein MC7420_5741 [Coleofasciculus chthonoplastes PCC 7420]|uniref:Uncharacterized protein n=1 Tax=Coleofasciculus chthonoplastes PCC 7420 TaxID=118168 RepID=B4VVK3_9CYAN|nr:hypothetical protein [Coleofasciculus chthonoplastes]EDX73861.1 hypothetical protein MC7420_5741 [Coleofasciculus chthonoplastes PCC 7420]
MGISSEQDAQYSEQDAQYSEQDAQYSEQDAHTTSRITPLLILRFKCRTAYFPNPLFSNP